MKIYRKQKRSALILQTRENLLQMTTAILSDAERKKKKKRNLVFPSCSGFGSRYSYPKGELHNDLSIYVCTQHKYDKQNASTSPTAMEQKPHTDAKHTYSFLLV